MMSGTASSARPESYSAPERRWSDAAWPERREHTVVVKEILHGRGIGRRVAADLRISDEVSSAHMCSWSMEVMLADVPIRLS